MSWEIPFRPHKPSRTTIVVGDFETYWKHLRDVDYETLTLTKMVLQDSFLPAYGFKYRDQYYVLPLQVAINAQRMGTILNLSIGDKNLLSMHNAWGQS